MRQTVCSGCLSPWAVLTQHRCHGGFNTRKIGLHISNYITIGDSLSHVLHANVTSSFLLQEFKANPVEIEFLDQSYLIFLKCSPVRIKMSLFHYKGIQLTWIIIQNECSWDSEKLTKASIHTSTIVFKIILFIYRLVSQAISSMEISRPHSDIPFSLPQRILHAQPILCIVNTTACSAEHLKKKLNVFYPKCLSRNIK